HVRTFESAPAKPHAAIVSHKITKQRGAGNVRSRQRLAQMHRARHVRVLDQTAPVTTVYGEVIPNLRRQIRLDVFDEIRVADNFTGLLGIAEPNNDAGGFA